MRRRKRPEADRITQIHVLEPFRKCWQISEKFLVVFTRKNSGIHRSLVTCLFGFGVVCGAVQEFKLIKEQVTEMKLIGSTFDAKPNLKPIGARSPELPKPTQSCNRRRLVLLQRIQRQGRVDAIQRTYSQCARLL